jgi:hypothetical protein
MSPPAPGRSSCANLATKMSATKPSTKEDLYPQRQQFRPAAFAS